MARRSRAVWGLPIILAAACSGCFQPPPVAATHPTMPQAAAAVQYYAPNPPPVPAAVEELPAASNAAVEAVYDEVAALRNEMAALRHELTGQVQDLVEELRKENQQLRDEVARLNALGGGAEEGPRVPVPEVHEAEAKPQEPTPAEPESKGPIAPFVFTSVKEWGRTPEEAARCTPKASSLAGMVGTIPRGSREKDLIDLGHKLREKYGAYDNINVEVFDSADAAKQFLERGAIDDERRALSLSKHAASGRDSIQVFRRGVPIDVAADAPAPAEKP